MIIYCSPAKTFKKVSTGFADNDLFKDKRVYLLEQLQKMSVQELQTLYRSSHTIAKKAYDAYQTPINMGPASHVFFGAAFKSLDVNTLSEKELSILNESLLIGDAYYGLIRPDTQLHHYRLDYTMSSLLIKYWKETINEYLEKVIKNKTKLIDLASTEYSQLLDTTRLSQHVNIIQPTFENANSYQLKKARGLMIRYLVQNPQKKVEDFNLDGYRHIGNYLFTKE